MQKALYDRISDILQKTASKNIHPSGLWACQLRTDRQTDGKNAKFRFIYKGKKKNFFRKKRLEMKNFKHEGCADKT
jgi:hypothetical protein